jgi:hypothetical protein
MSGPQEVTYAFDLRAIKSSNRKSTVGYAIPRIARLMALAIRFEGLVREKKIRDYAELARRGRVTRPFCSIECCWASCGFVFIRPIDVRLGLFIFNGVIPGSFKSPKLAPR